MRFTIAIRKIARTEYRNIGIEYVVLIRLATRSMKRESGMSESALTSAFLSHASGRNDRMIRGMTIIRPFISHNIMPYLIIASENTVKIRRLAIIPPNFPPPIRKGRTRFELRSERY